MDTLCYMNQKSEDKLASLNENYKASAETVPEHLPGVFIAVKFAVMTNQLKYLFLNIITDHLSKSEMASTMGVKYGPLYLFLYVVVSRRNTERSDAN